MCGHSLHGNREIREFSNFNPYEIRRNGR
jgi:hypothetical protein